MLRRGPVLAWCRARMRARVATEAAPCTARPQRGSGLNGRVRRVRAHRARRGHNVVWQRRGEARVEQAWLGACSPRQRQDHGTLAAALGAGQSQSPVLGSVCMSATRGARGMATTRRMAIAADADDFQGARVTSLC